MPKVWKAFRLRDRACKGSDAIITTSSRREAGCHLHGVFREEKVATEPIWQISARALSVFNEAEPVPFQHFAACAYIYMDSGFIMLFSAII